MHRPLVQVGMVRNGAWTKAPGRAANAIAFRLLGVASPNAAATAHTPQRQPSKLRPDFFFARYARRMRGNFFFEAPSRAASSASVQSASFRRVVHLRPSFFRLLHLQTSRRHSSPKIRFEVHDLPPNYSNIDTGAQLTAEKSTIPISEASHSPNYRYFLYLRIASKRSNLPY